MALSKTLPCVSHNKKWVWMALMTIIDWLGFGSHLNSKLPFLKFFCRQERDFYGKKRQG